MTVYLSGPMTGLPGHNVEAFHQAKALLESEGFTVLSPADELGNLTYEQFMKRDIAMVLASDAVYVLEGWHNSRGCAIEIFTAHVTGIPIIKLNDRQPVIGTELLNFFEENYPLGGLPC